MKEIVASSEPVILTVRGVPVKVLISLSLFEEFIVFCERKNKRKPKTPPASPVKEVTPMPQ